MLSTKVIKYLENNGKTESELDTGNVILRNDSITPPDEKVKINNDYIFYWNVSGVNEPTQGEIDSL